MIYVTSFCILWNFFVFSLYGADKYKAVHQKYRISESILIAPAFFLAAFGAMLGMIIFNHKTSKIKFRVLIPLAFIINIICLYFLLTKGFGIPV